MADNKQGGSHSSSDRDTKSSGNRSSDNKSSDSKSGANKSGSGSGTQGGTREQHAEAGRQSHKNDR